MNYKISNREGIATNEPRKLGYDKTPTHRYKNDDGGRIAKAVALSLLISSDTRDSSAEGLK
jgi:hypothetical protein